MKSNRLCGHVFVHNAIEYDYCIIESVQSLLPICDAVLVMDCSSTDGTDQLLRDHFENNKRVRLVFGQKWDVCRGGEGKRVRVIAEKCRALIRGQFGWQFMLQADEVLHEASRNAIRQAIASNQSGSFYCQRVDLWGSMNTCLAVDPYTFYGKIAQRMAFEITRLAHSTRRVVRDGCFIDQTKASRRYVNDIVIFHYGFVRDRYKLVRKVVDLWEWYHDIDLSKDDNFGPSRWLREGKPYDPAQFTGDCLIPLPCGHPRVARKWVEERRMQWETAD